MRQTRLSFKTLVDENKQQLLKDQKALDEIEKQLDERHVKNSNQTEEAVN